MKKSSIFYLLLMFVTISIGVLSLVWGKDEKGKGFATGFLGVFVIIFLISFIASFRKKKPKEEYDERQIIARGFCYKYAFFTLLGLYVSNVYINEVFDIEWAEETVKLFIFIAIGLMVFVITAINKNAYFAMNEERNPLGAIFLAVLSLIFIGFGIADIVAGNIVTDNKLNTNSIILISGFILTPIWLVKLLKFFRKDLEDEEL